MLTELLAEHPLAFVTVTESPSGPIDPVENVIERVPAPAVIVPLVIDQAYVAPAPASGTDAGWPLELGQTAPAVVITADGPARTVAVVVAGAEAHPPTIATTE